MRNILLLLTSFCDQWLPFPMCRPNIYTTIQWLFIVFAVYSSAFLYGLNTTIVSVVQGPVVERFGHVEKLGWLGISFLLVSVATIAAWAKAYAISDTKWLYVASLVNFAAGSALYGGANTMDALIVGRVWAGVGGAGMYLGQLSIYSGWRRNHLGCRLYLGPITGGLFADSLATWRWAFYINLVLFGLFCQVCLFSLRSYMPRPNNPLLERLKELDWISIILNAAMCMCFVLAFATGGTIWPWSDSRTFGSIIAMSVMVILFIVQQKFCIFTTKASRIFPLQFLRSRTFVLLLITQSWMMTSLAIPIYYIPLFFQFAPAETAVQSAVRLLPFVIVNIVVYLTACEFITVGGALFFGTLRESTSNAAIYGFSVLLAIGAGLAQQCAYSIATAKVLAQGADAIGFINNAQIRNALGGAKSRVFDESVLSEEVRANVERGIVDAVRRSFFPVLLAGIIGLTAIALMRWETVFNGSKESSHEKEAEDVKV
ncbi:MFS general substrate transporter [Setomelanomma holmii]|uniref:MFS general substrate transporter n=1 Tax=Setomelanomma holmii TaxID=210430 RepID=A0A9P4H2T4_9PLEO|nr:MFS general substrate transporter [Setomelanomma holmii]